MCAVVSVTFEDPVTFYGNKEYDQGVYILKLTGVYTKSHTDIKNIVCARYGFSRDWVASAYQIEIGTFYIKLGPMAIRKADPQGDVFQSGDLSVEIHDVHKKRGKLQVRYIPANITKEVITKIGNSLYVGVYTYAKV